MNIRFRILQLDPGAEQYLLLAKNEARRLIGLRQRNFTRTFPLGGGVTLTLRCIDIMGDAHVKIWLMATGSVAWSYRADELRVAPSRMFLVGANGDGKVLKAATNEPAGMLDTAGFFRTWNNFAVDCLVSANQKRYLADGGQEAVPGVMNFVYDNQYLGNVEWPSLDVDLNWFINRNGDCWASSSSYDGALTSEPTRRHIDIYAPKLPSDTDPSYGFYTSQYSWDDFFSQYLAGAGLSVWAGQGTHYVLSGWGNFDLPLYAIDGSGSGNDDSRRKNIVTFSWAYVTGAAPIPVGSGDWDVSMTQRVVTAVLDTKAASSELPDLPIDPATGRPALGKFRVLADDSYDYRLHYSFSFGTYKITGRFNEQVLSGAGSFGAPDFGAVVTAKGKVVHRKNVYAVVDYSDLDTPENKTLESAKIFVDGAEVYSCTDYPITVRASNPAFGTSWFDIYPVDNDAGLAFVFVKIIPITAGVPGDGYKDHYFLYRNGEIIDTGLEVRETLEGAQHVVLLNDGEHIIYWDTTLPDLRIWRAGHGVVYEHGPVVAASSGAVPALTPPLQYATPLKDVVNPLTFYADGYTCKVKWEEDGSGNRTYSVGTKAMPSKVLTADGVDYTAFQQTFIPFSAVPK